MVRGQGKRCRLTLHVRTLPLIVSNVKRKGLTALQNITWRRCWLLQKRVAVEHARGGSLLLLPYDWGRGGPSHLPFGTAAYPTNTLVYLTRPTSSSMTSRDITSRLRESVWNGSIPLELRLHNGDCRTYDDSDPYMVRASPKAEARLTACRSNSPGFHTLVCSHKDFTHFSRQT